MKYFIKTKGNRKILYIIKNETINNYAYDLTSMFGKDKEPTLEEIKTKYNYLFAPTYEKYM